jgi:hypothetical protein
MRLSVHPRSEQIFPPPIEALVELHEQFERAMGEDLVGAADGRRLGNDARTLDDGAHWTTGSTQIE